MIFDVPTYRLWMDNEVCSPCTLIGNNTRYTLTTAASNGQQFYDCVRNETLDLQQKFYSFN